MRLSTTLLAVSTVLALTACAAAPKEEAAKGGKPAVAAKAMKKDDKKQKKADEKKKPKVAAALVNATLAKKAKKDKGAKQNGGQTSGCSPLSASCVRCRREPQSVCKNYAPGAVACNHPSVAGQVGPNCITYIHADGRESQACLTNAQIAAACFSVN